MTDIILEAVRAVVLSAILIFMWNAGRRRFAQFQEGWALIITGFGLLLFGSLLDISDNFDSLNPLVVVGDTEVEAFLEKFVGFLGGFVFLAVGLFKWIPGVQGISDLVDDRTRELRETNEQLVLEIAERERAENVKHEFVSTVSHELRTPLTSIKGSLGLIRSGAAGALPEKLSAMLNIAYSNSDRLVLLINDILDMEKIQAGKMDFHMEPTELVSLVEAAMKANKGYGDAHRVTFVRSGIEGPALVAADKDRLMQVLSNLMSNAAKFSPDDARVELSVANHNGAVRIAVKDCGPGIPEKFKESVFEKFTQADPSDTRQEGGTGLGLCISREIVERHGGNIGFESEVGIGSTFFFTLPVAA